MKPKRRIVTSLALVALASLVSLGVFRGTQRAHAQDVAPPIPDRVSFGMVGITRNQTARLNVTNAGETRGMVINFRLVDSNGEVLRRRDGQPVERTMTLEPGHSAFLQFNADNLPGRDEARLNFRAVVTVTPPSGEVICPCDFPVTLEVVNNATGRTEWVLSGEHFRIPPPVPD